MKYLLIIDHSRHNWKNFFDNASLENDEAIQIEHASPSRINLVGHSKSGLKLELSPEMTPREGTDQNIHRSFEPDFCLIKKINNKLLYGLQFANIPAVNSTTAVYMNLERPIMFGGLVGIQQRLGEETFPLITQKYYPNHIQMNVSQEYPHVIKIGAAHAGYGKARIFDRHQYKDMVSVLALHSDYATIEPYFEVAYDYRIQKIGNSYRGYKRTSTNWKANTGSFMLEKMEVNEKHKLWADECSNLFGGMDILALDIIHTEGGEDYIIELNDSLIGFPREFQQQSLQDITDVVIERMNEEFGVN